MKNGESSLHFRCVQLGAEATDPDGRKLAHCAALTADDDNILPGVCQFCVDSGCGLAYN